MVKLTEKVVLGRARSHSLETVKNLNCWGSRLTDVTIVSKLENVEVINASTNSIESLEAFSHCTCLRELYLRRNAIKSLNEVLHLKSLPDLRVLWLSGNPCCKELSHDDYRMTVIKALPTLTKLDNVAITQDEFRRAMTIGEDLHTINSSFNASKEKDTATNVDNTENKSTVEAKSEKPETLEEKASEEKYAAVTGNEQTKTTSVVEETNELRKQLGFKPLPDTTLSTSHSSTSRSRTMGQTTTSINVLTASLALIREMDEEGLLTLQDAIKDRLHSLERENQIQASASGDSNLSNGLNSNKNSSTEMA